MISSRIQKLAKNLIEYSCKLEKGQILIIEGSEKTKELIIALVRHAYSIGAHPFVRLSNSRISRELLMGTTDEQSKLMTKYALPLFQDAHAYIGIGHSSNVFETSDVPNEKKQSTQSTIQNQSISTSEAKNTNGLSCVGQIRPWRNLPKPLSSASKTSSLTCVTLTTQKCTRQCSHLKNLWTKRTRFV